MAPKRPPALDRIDIKLMAALQRDRRASLAELATTTGWSAATVARRLADLQAGGTVFFDLEVDAAALGATTHALLWMSVAPAHLDAVARELATHPELALVAATTGPANLVAHALCPDAAGLHHYLTRRLGALDAIHTLETAPVLRTLKAAASRWPAASPEKPWSARSRDAHLRGRRQVQDPLQAGPPQPVEHLPQLLRRDAAFQIEPRQLDDAVDLPGGKPPRELPGQPHPDLVHDVVRPVAPYGHRSRSPRFGSPSPRSEPENSGPTQNRRARRGPMTRNRGNWWHKSFPCPDR